jgi:hypothetical protein
MTAHIYVPAIESRKDLPATLSYNVLTIYDYSTFNLQVASEIIAGKCEAQGILPVTLKN